MQHVLRCWERQSNGSKYKKPFGGRGSAPDPSEGAYSAPANSLVGGEGLAAGVSSTNSLVMTCIQIQIAKSGAVCPSQRTPSPALGPSGLASRTPTPELVPTPLSFHHLSYRDELGRYYKSNRMGISGRSQKEMGAWGSRSLRWGLSDPLTRHFHSGVTSL